MNSVPIIPIVIITIPVIIFITLSPFRLILFLNLLIRKVSVVHHMVAPKRIELIPIVIVDNVDSLERKSNLANKAIKTSKTRGFDSVNPNEVMKSLKRLFDLPSDGFGCADG